jgi:hypothetical protein
VHQYLMGADPSYAKSSWGERFRVLPEKVEALHGRSPHSEKVGVVPTTTAPSKKVTQPPPPGPVSFSDIPAGRVPPAISEVERLEKMDAVQLKRYLDTLSPDQLASYLSNFS